MGPQRRLDIYVGYDSPSIIRYLEPLTGDVFTARFADCHFNESIFPSLGGEMAAQNEPKEIDWNASRLHAYDPRSSECELEVQRIIKLQNIANEIPDAFTDTKRVTKSYIPAANAPARIEIPKTPLKEKQLENKPRQKRGRPIGAKDTAPRKKKQKNKTPEENDLPCEKEEEIMNPLEHDKESMGKDISGNTENSICYVDDGKTINRYETEINDIFIYHVATDIEINTDNDPEPRSIDECRQRNDWPKWKEAIQVELNSLSKREVFGPIVPTPEGIKPVGHKWVFVRKRNEKNEIIRYKARLVAQGFSQMPGVDYEETYSPVMHGITF